MRIFKWIIIFSFLLSYGYVDGSENSRQIRFIAGLTILKSNGSLTPLQKARYYSELQKITGVTSQQAVQFIESYRNNPREWKKIQDSIDTIVSGEKNIK
jgi:hypothetical protein